MLGNRKVDTQKAMQNIARQKLMRGQAADANMIQNFGQLGAGAALQALSNTLRGNVGQIQNTQIGGSNTIKQTSDANKRKATSVINSAQKSNDKSALGGSILGVIGK